MSNTTNWRGNLVADPEIKNGNLVEVVIAHNPLGKAKEKFVPVFVRATLSTESIWGKMAQECRKGDRALIEGQMQIREYEGKKGKGYSVEIPFVSCFEKLGRPEMVVPAEAAAPDVDPFA